MEVDGAPAPDVEPKCEVCGLALAADFMLVWLPAPTYAVGGSKSLGARRSVIGKMMNVFEGCPENAFQRVAALGDSLIHWSGIRRTASYS